LQKVKHIKHDQLTSNTNKDNYASKYNHTVDRNIFYDTTTSINRSTHSVKVEALPQMNSLMRLKISPPTCRIQNVPYSFERLD